MLDNLNSKFESSRVQALDVNDDEVEIDLLEIFHALRKKILLVLMVALIGGCIGAGMYTVPDDTNLQFNIQYACSLKGNHADISGGSAVRCQSDK